MKKEKVSEPLGCVVKLRSAFKSNRDSISHILDICRECNKGRCACKEGCKRALAGIREAREKIDARLKKMTYLSLFCR